LNFGALSRCRKRDVRRGQQEDRRADEPEQEAEESFHGGSLGHPSGKPKPKMLEAGETFRESGAHEFACRKCRRAVAPRGARRADVGLGPAVFRAEAWEADFARLAEATAPVLALQGKLDSVAAVAQLFAAETALDRLLEKLHVYAHLRHDEDTADDANQVREARIRARYAEIAGQCAWITPELLAHPEAELRAWLDAPELRECRRTLLKVLRNKPHVLSAAEEILLARGAEVLSASEQTYGLLTNADLAFPDIPGADGQPLPLTEGTYRAHLENPDRGVRKAAFETLLGASPAQNTFPRRSPPRSRRTVYFAEVRKFSSALDAACSKTSARGGLRRPGRGPRTSPATFHATSTCAGAHCGCGPDSSSQLARSCPRALPRCRWRRPRRGRRRAARWVRNTRGAAMGVRRALIDCSKPRGKPPGALLERLLRRAAYLLLNHHDRSTTLHLAHELAIRCTLAGQRAQPPAPPTIRSPSRNRSP
jgi:hypothetical protein